MAITRNVTVYIGNRINRELLKEGNSASNAEKVESIEIDEYLTVGYTGVQKFTVTISKTKAFLSVNDVSRMFGVDLSKKAVAVNEYNEELVTLIILKRALQDSRHDDKLNKFQYINGVVENILQLMK